MIQNFGVAGKPLFAPSTTILCPTRIPFRGGRRRFRRGRAVAFAGLENVISGLSLKISQPFTIGETIKAGSFEGRVVGMGLTHTSLFTAESFVVDVPNSLISSQGVENKSRAPCVPMTSNIPLQPDDLDKVPQISNAIKEMLESDTNVYLENEAPYCRLSRVETSFLELIIGCDLKNMSRSELVTAKHDILIEAARIIEEHGAQLADFD